jgi:ferritin-like metal-binding protein YciE
MDIRSIRDVLETEIPELYGAEGQALEVLPEMIELASDDRLRQALQEHAQLTRDHRLRLETVASELQVELDGSTSPGLTGILDRGATVVRKAAAGPVRDAVIIASVQKVEHYEIAGYGAAVSYARLLGEEDVAELLVRTLDEEKEADRTLTGIAENFVNEAAIDGGGSP